MAENNIMKNECCGCPMNNGDNCGICVPRHRRPEVAEVPSGSLHQSVRDSLLAQRINVDSVLECMAKINARWY
ncbi:MAG: hypothetical protein HY764_02040 [Candidatus Portnoybacteria bacterium]|nr:hypothetical protein [Candidatus Portnoybacteria bacterium]